jgi:hypothetical protein
MIGKLRPRHFRPALPRTCSSLLHENELLLDDFGGRFWYSSDYALGDQRSRPIIDAPYRFLEAHGRQVSAEKRLGKSIRYTLPRWDGLIRFLDDGRINLVNNAVERDIPRWL